jgi:hypothetical protein
MAVTLVLAAHSNLPAALVTESFYLDQSNELPDGTNYGIVELTADSAAGTVAFVVTAPYTYSGVPGRNYGFDKFYFNANDLLLTTDFTISGPVDWQVDQGSHQASGFGKYDFLLTPAPGLNSSPTLEFTIQLNAGKESWATIGNFANTNGADAAKPPLYFFAGHVKDFAQTFGETSHFATGSTPVPEPSAIVLWGLCGAIGLVLARRLRSRSVQDAPT